MSKDAPLLSVGIPVYNGQNYLPEAIESLLGQTYGDFELIISDNASTDATEEISRFYENEDRRVRYERSEVNVGLVGNFNRVFELSRSSYFKWAAHDDLCGKQFLELCIEVMESNPQVAVCCPSASAIDDSGDLILASGIPVNRRFDPMGCHVLDDGDVRDHLNSPQPHKRFREILLHSTRCYEEFGVIRSEAIRKVGLRENYRGSEKVFLAALSLVGKIEVLEDRLFYPRWHDDRYSNKATANEQNASINPERNEKDNMVTTPRQFRCVSGYFDAIRRMNLPIRERALCYGVLTRFLCQFSKFGAVYQEATGGACPTTIIPADSVRGRRPDDVPPPSAIERWKAAPSCVQR